MTWFKVDDHFWGHPKQTALPKGAAALWVRAGSWSANLLSDGFVPTHMVAMLGGNRADSRALVKAELWTSVDGGFQFHDWATYQPSREQIEKKRDDEAERKAEWRRKKAAQRAVRDEALKAVPDVSRWDNRVSPASVPAGVPGVVPDLSRSSRPDPTRPDPSLPTEETLFDAPKRVTQAPKSFEITESMRTWATANKVGVDLERETSRFLDWHRAKGSKFKDWTAAWRNWMSKAAEYAQPKQGGLRNPEEMHSPATRFSG